MWQNNDGEITDKHLLKTYKWLGKAGSSIQALIWGCVRWWRALGTLLSWFKLNWFSFYHLGKPRCDCLEKLRFGCLIFCISAVRCLLDFIIVMLFIFLINFIPSRLLWSLCLPWKVAVGLRGFRRRNCLWNGLLMCMIQGLLWCHTQLKTRAHRSIKTTRKMTRKMKRKMERKGRRTLHMG